MSLTLDRSPHAPEPTVTFLHAHAWSRTERGWRCLFCDLHTTRPTLAGCAGTRGEARKAQGEAR